MKDHLLRTALLAEVTAILSSQYTAPQAKVLWLVVAAVIYWHIARGTRFVHGFQCVVALLGVVVTGLGGGWPALAYAVEAGALAALWQHRDARREQRDA